MRVVGPSNGGVVDEGAGGEGVGREIESTDDDKASVSCANDLKWNLM